MTVFVLLTESLLLTPEVFESPELKRVRFVVEPDAIPSDVFDSDNERICLAEPFESI